LTPVYTSHFRDDLDYWDRTKPKLKAKILRLVKESIKEPFTGIGKPVWSAKKRE